MKIKVELKNNSYDIILAKGILGEITKYIPKYNKILIVTDSGVPKEYTDHIMKNIPCAERIVIPEGEPSKNIMEYQRILVKMTENNFTRNDAVIAVGGGVVGDISGFAASTYMRGIDFYNIPTTLLSQVDSSIGGKTAIDFNGIKNIVGTFYQPKRVIIDPDTLKTLPKRHISNGIAESIKMALTFDEELFNELMNGNIENIEHIIEKSLLIKKYVVEKDEKESDLRRVLNFGHTIGHGIESTASPVLYHGECVALGMIPMCSCSVREKLIKVLKVWNLPTDCRFNVDRVMSAVSHDKKSAVNGINAVKVDKPGEFYIEKMTLSDIEKLVIDTFGEKI